MDTVQAPRAARRQHRHKPRPDLTHWPKEWECQVRAARNTDGEAIHALVDATTMRYGYKLPPCNWAHIEPFWYVAEVAGLLLGAVQVCIGRPVARVELLAIRPGLSQRKKAKVMKVLLAQVAVALTLDGATLVSTLIPEADKGFQTILERHGARQAVKGRMMLYTLPHGGQYGL